MSNRERWVVYPLLFLALSASLRDKVTGHSQSLQYITSDAMTLDLQHGIVSTNVLEGVKRIRGTEIQGDTIRATAIHAHRLTVDEIHCLGIVVHDQRRKAACSLEATAAGGVLKLEDSDGNLSLVLGHFPEGNLSGLVALGKDGKSATLTRLIQRPDGPPAAVPATAPSAEPPVEPATQQNSNEPQPSSEGQPPEPADAEGL